MRHSRIAALLEQLKNDSREALKNNERKHQQITQQAEFRLTEAQEKYPRMNI